MKLTDRLTNKLKHAEHIVFLTGAGISAESGVPTFRGNEGLWRKFSPAELANFSAFMQNPDLVWEWYEYRRHIVREALPNPGHIAIKNFEEVFPKVTVITQNVDNLHTRAGSSVINELHGNIERNYCIRCKKRYDYIVFERSEDSPRCECGGLIRPDVVWFGEELPHDIFKNSENACRSADVFFMIGTSGVVFPAAALPYTARGEGAYLIEINIESTDLSQIADEHFFAPAGVVLPEMLEMIRTLRQ